MGARKVLLFKTHVSYPNMGFTIRSLFQRLCGLFKNLWFVVSTCMLPLFGVISSYFFRLDMKNHSVEFSSRILGGMSEKQGKRSKRDVLESSFSENETSEFSFKFKFPTYEEFIATKRGDGEFVSSEAVPSKSIGMYVDLPKFNIREPEPVSFSVEEVSAGPNDASFESKYINDEEEDLSDSPLNVVPLEKLEKTKESNISGVTREINEKKETGENDLQVSDEIECSSMDSDFKWMGTDGFLSEKDFGETFELDYLIDIDDKKAESSDEMSDSDESLASYGFDGEDSDIMKELGELEEDCVDSPKTDSDETQKSYDYEVDSDIMKELGELEEDHVDSAKSDFDESQASNDFEGEDSDIMKELGELEEDRVDSAKSDSDGSQASYDFEGEDSDIVRELKKLEDHVNITDTITSNFLSQKDFNEGSDNSSQGENDKSINSATNSELQESKKISVVETEDTNKLETLWEHQDLVEQLKMEFRKVRASGLPTILEDSESAKIMEDLKPWKIDEKFQHQNPMGELHKFYNSYREKMRKLDVLTYQKMYAIGFLQLKEPGHSSSTKKTSIPDIASILSESLYQYKAKKHETDPMKKLINELQTELELVYVGQMCLSWEFLHWQYGMALDLWDSDPRGLRRYNEVAGEFQQFQVLVNRFLEDEPFQGPRVQNYIKHRCVFRDFLQIPVIREDVSNDGKKGKGIQRGDYTITSDILVEILEESIRLFWRFVRADKQCSHAKISKKKAILVDPQEPAASEILVELQKDLQKKAKKLKDQLRSSHCILKKFRKCQEDDSSSNQVLFFFSQVDMKLVSRVLSMSKLTTEQLAWCHSKLSSISFINRKVHVEPSFCLFPC